MRLNVRFVSIIVLALFTMASLVGCITTKPPETEETYDPVFVQNVTPKLQAMVDEGKMSQESMDLIIERIKEGVYVRPDVQAILAGTTPPPVPGEAPPAKPAPTLESDAPYDEAWLKNLTPQLTELVEQEKMTQTEMDEIIEKIKQGEYDRDDVRPILEAKKAQ